MRGSAVHAALRQGFLKICRSLQGDSGAAEVDGGELFERHELRQAGVGDPAATEVKGGEIGHRGDDASGLIIKRDAVDGERDQRFEAGKGGNTASSDFGGGEADGLEFFELADGMQAFICDASSRAIRDW
jgi:hypothetical protein